MSDSTFEIITRSPEQTHALGRQLGEALTDGIVLSLEGDLGSGKTVFVQGLGSGALRPRGNLRHQPLLLPHSPVPGHGFPSSMRTSIA